MKQADVTGMRFGKLFVLERSTPIGAHIKYLCQCDCGNTSNAYGENLRLGKSRSCGCLSYGNYKHGYSSTVEYHAWKNMHKRCKSDKNCNYKNYGARGIKVCKEWDSFETFLADMGKRPSDLHSIDRIDNNGDYYPENCRWTTRDVQLSNRRPYAKRKPT